MEIQTIGGYEEVGKNMTAVKVGDEIIIMDMGIHLDNYIKYTEDEDIVGIRASELVKVGAIPDIKDLEVNKVKAIVLTHAHLDHLGAVPFLSNKFNAPIICTPYTGAVLRAIIEDNKMHLKNEIKAIAPNSTYKISKNIKIELVNTTHSVPQTVMITLHTKDGILVYANDFKFDLHPVMGQKPNFKRLKELGKKGVKILIMDSIYSQREQKTPSESVAKQMLKDVLFGIRDEEKGIIITTFSSHLTRLKSIIEFGKLLDRKVVLLGRSLAKYVYAGEDIGLIKFSDKADIVKYSRKIKKKLREIQKDGKEKYIIVVTGHQGEPKAVLSKMINKEYDFHFSHDDSVIFSCTIIPSEVNTMNREKLEDNLKSHGVRIFKDIHVSGHASREDHRDLINMLKPKHIIPAHVEHDRAESMAELCEQIGYKTKETVHIMKNGQKLVI